METPVNRPILAAVLALLAMGLFGLIDNYMRLAADTGSLWQFHLLRSVIALVLLGIVAAVMRISLRPKRPRNVLARSLLNGFAMVIYFGCLGFMPIAQVVAGLFTAPIFVVLFSVIFFGEKVASRRIIAVILGFVGIVLALRPDAADFGAVTLLPVLAGATYAMGNIATRRWCGGEGTLVMLASFFSVMLSFGAIGVALIAVLQPDVPAGPDGFVIRGWVTPDPVFAAIIVVQGVGSLIGVGLSIRAYQLADASFVAVFENTLLVFATVWAVILWGEVPDTLGLVGLACIAAAGVIIAIRSEAPQPVRAATFPE